MEVKVLNVELDTAKKWYKSGNVELEALALQLFREEDLNSKEVKTWDDLIGTKIPKESYFIGGTSRISKIITNQTFDIRYDKHWFIDEKHAKSALAMAQISQLIPYYGGVITDTEWNNSNVIKYVIARRNNSIISESFNIIYHLLAFHTREQRDEFLKNNKQLVMDYFML